MPGDLLFRRVLSAQRCFLISLVLISHGPPERSATVANATEHRPAAPHQAKATATEHCLSVPQHVQARGETQGRPSVADPAIELHVHAVLPESLATVSLPTEPIRDITVNKAMTLPQKWPLGRPQLGAREERLGCSELRLGFASAVQQEQHAQGLPLLPPCS